MQIRVGRSQVIATVFGTVALVFLQGCGKSDPATGAAVPRNPQEAASQLQTVFAKAAPDIKQTADTASNAMRQGDYEKASRVVDDALQDLAKNADLLAKRSEILYLRGQWEAAESVAMTRRQTLWMIILPQCVKRMTPPWMNLYAILTVATPLTSVVGVSEAMTLTGDILSSEARTELLVPMYLYLLLWFFLYCYPIARATLALENRFAVR